MVRTAMMVSDKLAQVKNSIRAIGKDPEQIQILAVTKKQSVEAVRAAIACGIKLFGNNYAQEGEDLMRELPHPDLEWHFIGHIQSRKIKFLPSYQMVQSLDRIKVARALNELLAENGAMMKVLVEVNIGEEEGKSGVYPDKLAAFLDELSTFKNLQIKGLMALPPPLQPVDKRTPYFQKMAELFKRQKQIYSMETLSMGTSDDYLQAIRHGATLIRLGTILLGHRS